MEKLLVSCVGHLSDRVSDLWAKKVVPEGMSLEYFVLDPVSAFKRLGRREFDVGEMSLSTHIVRVSRGDPQFVAIPIFPSRCFRHSAIYVLDNSGIETPSDLVGRRVGVPEYQMTAALWVRGMLQHDYGVEPGQLRWVTAGLRDPGRRPLVSLSVPGIDVTHVEDYSLDQMLLSGDIDAIVAPQAPPSFGQGRDTRRLFSDCRSVEQDYFRRTHLFPIMHTVVMHRTFYEQYPWAAVSLYEAFDEARLRAMRRLSGDEPLPIALPWLAGEVKETKDLMGDDFWPYGVKRNRMVLETACQYAFEQGLTERQVEVDELFVPATLDADSAALL